jgi:hypothetical protein
MGRFAGGTSYRPYWSSKSYLAPPVDELPELGEFLESFVLGHGELGAVEEILEGVFVQDAVDEEAGVGALEVDAVFLGAIAVEVAFLAVELAEFFGVGLVEVLGQEIEFAEDLELEELGQFGELGGAAVVEDYLKHGGLISTGNDLNRKT